VRNVDGAPLPDVLVTVFDKDKISALSKRATSLTGTLTVKLNVPVLESGPNPFMLIDKRYVVSSYFILAEHPDYFRSAVRLKDSNLDRGANQVKADLYLTPRDRPAPSDLQESEHVFEVFQGNEEKRHVQPADQP
jgi:hypothetical protein